MDLGERILNDPSRYDAVYESARLLPSLELITSFTSLLEFCTSTHVLRGPRADVPARFST